MVIGAGIAGLAAAWTLRSQQVSVLEAGDSVGGRMRSELINGYPMETGAQFLGSGYTVVPRLAAAVGLATSPIRAGAAVFQGGAMRRFRSDRPLSQFTGGLLPWPAAPRAAAGLIKAAAAGRGRATSDLTCWTDLDTEPAREWAERVLGPDVTDRVLIPTVSGFYFQSLDQSSAALPAAVCAFAARPGPALTIRGGLGRLTRSLAAEVDVRINTTVTSVRRDGARAVVTTTDGEEVADRVILAVPASAARAILHDPTDLQRRLTATPYSRGLLVGVPLSAALRPHQLAGAYGILVHPGEENPVAAVAVASRAHPAAADRDLLTVMLNQHAADALRAADDATVVKAALAGLRRLDPTVEPLLPPDTDTARVVRHQEAMPTVPTGHAAAVVAYRDRPRADPIALAGDYLGFPWTDSAAATGVWAGRRLR
ncbi:protoporphyrinogen/coproporphyrinogen oxidase [Pilimelia columellifera]|uniref:NAD(P)/FAD-dependent oxidoreductase n=1 Tax=Pilimelia columellifera subsp. columellifera TaxID=706583 RepID=A0ABP6AQT3_9ACTN